RRDTAFVAGEARDTEIALCGARTVFLRQRRHRDRPLVAAFGPWGIRDHRDQPDLPQPRRALGRGAGPRYRLAGHRNLRFAAGRQRLRPHPRAAAGPEDQCARGGRLARGLHRRRSVGRPRPRIAHVRLWELLVGSARREVAAAAGVANTVAIAVVSGTDNASAIPPTAERAISIATLSLVSTSPSDRFATENSRSSGRELPA